MISVMDSNEIKACIYGKVNYITYLKNKKIGSIFLDGFLITDDLETFEYKNCEQNIQLEQESDKDALKFIFSESYYTIGKKVLKFVFNDITEWQQ